MCTSSVWNKLQFCCLFVILSFTFTCPSFAQQWENINPSLNNLDQNGDIIDFISTKDVLYLAYQGYSTQSSTDKKGVVIMQLKNATWSELGFFPEMHKLKIAVDSISNTPYIAFFASPSKSVIQKFENNQWIDLGSLEQPIDRLDNLNLVLAAGIPYVSFGTWVTESQRALIVLKLENDQWKQLGKLISIPADLATHHLMIDQAIPYLAFIHNQSNSKINIRKLNNDDWNLLPKIPNEPKNIQNLNIAIQNKTLYITYNTKLIAKTTTVQQFLDNNWQTPITIAHSSAVSSSRNLLIHNQIPILSYWIYTDDSKQCIEQVYNNHTTTLGELAALSNCYLSLDQNNLYAAYKEVSSDYEPSSSNKKSSNIIIKKQTLRTPVAAKELDAYENSFALSPNPVKNILRLKTSASIKNLTIISIDGKVIKTAQHNNRIATNELSKGNYILQINTTKGIVYKKFEKQ